ncbi:MAG: tetratricopeptide repeat protein [Tenacibaculum sp.]
MKKQLLTLSLALVALSAAGQKAELKMVEKALKKQNYNEAINSLSAAEKLIENADNKYKSKFYFLKGQTFAAKKDYKKAAEAFTNLIDFEKKISTSKYSKEAQPILTQMISDISNKAIKIYNESKDYKLAAQYFYLTYQLSPTDTSFVYNAAVAATQANDYDLALKHYKELNKLGYTGIEIQYWATEKLSGEAKRFNSKQERDLLVKSKQYIKPENKKSESKMATIVKNIALLLKEQGKTEEAIVAMADARKSNPKDLNLILNEAQLYIEINRMDKFGELMKEAVSLDPNNPTLYFNLGVVNYNQGRIEEARGYYEKAIKLKPDYADAYMNLSVSILDKDKAIVEEINQNLSNSEKYDELALKQKEVYKEALPYLEKADSIKRNLDTVRTLMNIYEVLEVADKANKYRALYKSMK